MTFSIILILVGIGVYYFFFIDQWSQLAEIGLDKTAALNAEAQLQDISSKADEMRNTYNSVKQSDKDKLSFIIPKGEATPSVVTDINALAVRNGMVLKAIDFGSGAARSNILTPPPANVNPQTSASSLIMNFEITGRYDSFRQFLTDLELNQRLIDVASINFGAATNLSYNFSLRAKAYYK